MVEEIDDYNAEYFEEQETVYCILKEILQEEEQDAGTDSPRDCN